VHLKQRYTSTTTSCTILSAAGYNTSDKMTELPLFLKLANWVYTRDQTDIPKSVTCVRFDQNVDEVKEEAFKGCFKLKKVVLNEGLRKIGKNAFSYCTSLQSITLPSTIVEIEEQAFYRCRKLKKVVLNDGLKKIGKEAFSECKSLQSITFPSTVVEIGDYALEYTALRRIKLPPNLTEVNQSAFHACSKLRR